MGFALKDLGDRYKCIYEGKHWIGRVCQHADGTYIGIIGKYIIVRGCRSEKEAFNEAVAQHQRYGHHVEKQKHHKAAPTMKSQKEKMKSAVAMRVIVPAGPPAPPEIFAATRAQMRPRA